MNDYFDLEQTSLLISGVHARYATAMMNVINDAAQKDLQISLLHSELERLRQENVSLKQTIDKISAKAKINES